MKKLDRFLGLFLSAIFVFTLTNVSVFATSSLYISASSNNQTIAEIGDDVILGEFEFSNNGGNDVLVEEIVFTQFGTATNDSLDQIKLFDKSTNVVLDIQALSSANKVEFDDSFEIASGKVITLQLLGKLNDDIEANETIAFKIASANDVEVQDSDGDNFQVNGAFPVKGGTTTFKSDTEDEDTDENAEEEINEITDEIDDVTDDLTSDDDEVEEAIEEIEEAVDEIEETIEETENAGNNAQLHRNVLAKMKALLIRIRIAHKNQNQGQLKSLQTQFRNLLTTLEQQEIKATKRVQLISVIKEKNVKIEDLKKQILLAVRWGQIKNTGSGEISTTESESWDGSVSIENGKIALVREILFEDNDEVTSESTEKIEFTSEIAGYSDGILIKVFPDDEGSYDETTITVEFDDQEGLTYTKEDFEAGASQDNLDDDGKGVVIVRKKAGVVGNELLENFKEEYQDKIKDLLEDVDEEYQEDVSGLIEDLDEETQEDFVNKQQQFSNNLAKLVKHLALIDQEKRQELLEKKLEILEEAENLEELIDSLDLSDEVTEGLKEILALIEEYNFDATTALQVKNKTRQFIEEIENGNLTEDEILNLIEECQNNLGNYQSQAKVQKFVQGIIPFKDTDDGDWFTEYVSYVKNKSIVGGYKDSAGNELGEFRPANNVTIAEVLKMALESAEIGADTSEEDPQNTNAIDHWAEGYFKQAENLGLTIVSDTSIDPNQLATRGEVIRLILEVLGIEPDDVTETDFSDVSADDPNAAYIQYAKDAGVISGDSDSTTFRPDDSINRAEVAKILQNMIEILKTALDVTE